METMNKNFIHEYDFKSSKPGEEKLKKVDSTFKVLKIRNCPNVRDLITTLRENEFDKVIKQTTHLFIINVEVNDEIEQLNDTDLSVLKSLTDIGRPLIIQLTSIKTSDTLVYCKDENDEVLRKLNNIKPITWKEMLKQVQFEETTRFELLLRLMTSAEFGSFNGRLLECQLDLNKMKEITKELVQYSSLCLRFMNLYESNNDLSMDVIASCQNLQGIGRFLSYLDLPLNVRLDVRRVVSENSDKIVELKDSFWRKLFKISIKLNNSRAVSYFANYRKFDLKRACVLAIKKKSDKSFVELIDAGSPFPDGFTINVITDTIALTKLEQIINERNDFHENIASEKYEKVKQYVKKSPNQKTMFSIDNKSALTTALTIALKKSEFRIYAFLESKGFSTEGDTHFKNVRDEESNIQNKGIRDAKKEFFKQGNDVHVTNLLLKTKYTLGSIKLKIDYSAITQSIYTELSSMPEINPILRAIATSEDLNIILDFTESSVKRMDPAGTEGTEGIVYPTLGYIYVGVKDHKTKRNKVMGVIVHEMTHYAMQLVYENKCKPYRMTDIEREKDFNVILEKTKIDCDLENQFPDPIFTTVFELYSPEAFVAELIVRIPQLLVHYKDKSSKLKTIKSSVEDLFSFFLGKVAEDLISYEDKGKKGNIVAKINQSGYLLNEIRNMSGNFQKKVIEKLSQTKKLKVFSSNVPIMTLVAIHKKIEENNGVNIYLRIKSIENQKLILEIKNVFQTDINLIVVIGNTESGINEKQLKDFLDKCDYINNVILVISDENKNELESKGLFFGSEISTCEHTWGEVVKEYQTKLMKQEINFQISRVKLIKLLNFNSDAMLKCSLNDLLEHKEININVKESTDGHFFIDRKFLCRVPKVANDVRDSFLNQKSISGKKDEQAYEEIKTTEITKQKVTIKEMDFEDEFKLFEMSINELIALAISNRVVIISDKAGTGKSSVLHEISKLLKESNKTHWVSFVDLKQHTEAFKTKFDDNVTFENFMVETVFRNADSFEKEIFLHLHKEGRSILLLDGFDEITPTYKEIWVKALKSFNSTSGNQLWITSRPHLEESLEKSLNCTSCRLTQFSEKEQVEYLEKYLASDELNDEKKTETESMARKLIEKLNSFSSSVITSFGIPQILSMLAQIYKESNKTSDFFDVQSLNIYSIYEQYVDLFIEKYEKTGEIARRLLRESIKSKTSIWQIHEIFALKHKKLSLDVEYDEEDWTAELLSGIGIFQEKNGVESFLHESFADYFVARHVLTNLDSKGEKLDGVVKLFIEVLQREEHQVVRLFLNQGFEHKSILKIVTKLEPKIEYLSGLFKKQIEETKSYKVMVNVTADSCETLISFIVKITKKYESDLIEKMLEFEREFEGEKMNALQLSMTENCDCFIEKLFEIIGNIETQEIKKKIVQQTTNNYKLNIFHLVAKNKSEQVFAKLLNCVDKILSKEEVKVLLQQNNLNKFNIFHYVARFYNEKATKKIFIILETRLTKKEFEKLLTDKNINGDNCLHVATRFNSKAVAEELFSFLGTFLDETELNELFKSCGFRERNIFHFAASNKENEGVFSKLLEIVNKILSEEELKVLFQQNDLDKNNISHCVACFNNEKSMYEIFTILETCLTKKEFEKLLTNKNINGDNCLHVATCFNSKAVAEELCSFLVTNLDESEVKELFKSCGFRGINIFQCATLIKENEGVFAKLLECVDKILSEEDVKVLLQQNNSNKSNMVHFVAQFNNEKAMKEIFKILKTRLTKKEFEKLLTDKSSNSNNCLHLVTKHNSKAVAEELFGFLVTNLDESEVKELFKSCGFRERNIFHFAASNKENVGVFAKLLDCADKILSKEEVKLLLQQNESNQYNIAHFVARFNNEKAMKEIFTTLKTRLTKKEFEKLLTDKNSNGDNCLHLATCLNSEAVVVELCSFLRTFLYETELKELFKSCGKQGINIFHCAALNKENKGVFAKLLDCVDKILSEKEVKVLLQQNSSNQYNIVHFVARFNNEKALK